MPKFLALHVAVLAGLVLAVGYLTFQNRDLRVRVLALESAKPVPAAKAPVDQPPRLETPSEDLEPVYVEGNPKPPPPTGTKPPAPAPARSEILTPAQEQAVAQSVEKVLQEKYGHLPKVAQHEDPEKVMERELNLTASQKERISALLKKKREESGTIFKGGNPFSGANLQRAMEHDAKYEAAIKNELDAAQQAKYDQLKKDGKLGGGIVIQIDAGGEEEQLE